MTDRPAEERQVARMVHYAGRVQGIGFRATAAWLAQKYPVTGWVKNLDDGRVQLLAEGPESAVRAFLNEVRARFRSHIQDEQTEICIPSGTLIRFQIAY
jgi:acylphosphatase